MVNESHLEGAEIAAGINGGAGLHMNLDCNIGKLDAIVRDGIIVTIPIVESPEPYSLVAGRTEEPEGNGNHERPAAWVGFGVHSRIPRHRCVVEVVGVAHWIIDAVPINPRGDTGGRVERIGI